MNSTIDDRAMVAQIEDSLRERLVAAAEFAAEKVARNTPWKTGKEVGSIVYRINEAEIGFKVVVAEFYSAFQEFGSSHQRARPFLAPTMRNSMDEILKIMGNQ